MTVNSTRMSSPAAARLPVVCALLLGLFLMHGSPVTAAHGCHGASAGPASPAAAETHRHGASTMVVSAAGMSAGLEAHVGVPMASEGAMCVSTPAHGQVMLPAIAVLALVATAATWLLTSRTTGLSAARRRAPPGGRPLLLQVCVARM